MSLQASQIGVASTSMSAVATSISTVMTRARSAQWSGRPRVSRAFSMSTTLSAPPGPVLVAFRQTGRRCSISVQNDRAVDVPLAREVVSHRNGLVVLDIRAFWDVWEGRVERGVRDASRIGQNRAVCTQRQLRVQRYGLMISIGDRVRWSRVTHLGRRFQGIQRTQHVVQAVGFRDEHDIVAPTVTSLLIIAQLFLFAP
jgi:hypothetical protein